MAWVKRIGRKLLEYIRLLRPRPVRRPPPLEAVEEFAAFWRWVERTYRRRFYRVQQIWELWSLYAGEALYPASETRIYIYTVATSDAEAERKYAGEFPAKRIALEDPAQCDAPIYSWSYAESMNKAREEPYGIEVEEVDPDEVEDLDVFFAYVAFYRRRADRITIHKSYKFRWEANRWRLIETGPARRLV